MVMEVVQEDMGDGNMQCADHPYKNSAPGGICAFCLQEKLGKLVSSSFPVAIFPSSSSSPSPSFRSEFSGVSSATASSLALAAASHHISNECHEYYTRRSKMPFLLTQRRKKKKDGAVLAASSSDSTHTNNSVVFKRSKSTTTPRRRSGGMHFLDSSDDLAEGYSPHKKGFWSFLYLSSSSKQHSTTKKGERSQQRDMISYPSSSSVRSSREKKREELVVVDENESPDEAALDRKVSRSRSVGCGSRSFSGDFFERISTGFGDCTLRRVESQREGGNKPKVHSSVQHRNSTTGAGQDCIKERVKCGGIFSGFMITSSNSSSSSSSSYWASTEDNVNGNGNNGRSASTPGGSSVRHLAHGRSKSWGWALASPMRAFGKPSNNGGKRDQTSNKNATPNLEAIPSLLAVRS